MATTKSTGAPAAPIITRRSAKIEWGSVRDNGLDGMFELRRLTIGNSWKHLVNGRY